MITAGLDIGSVSTEIVILNDGDLLDYLIIDTGNSSKRVAERIFSMAMEKLHLLKSDLSYVVTTGYGRSSTNIGNKNITELSCHARGAWHIDNNVKTVIDIGGQDSKVIKVSPKGKSLDFVMNDKCAAGTGRFLEVMARALEVKVEDLGKFALSTEKKVQVSSMCTVFAESEVVSLIAEGCDKELIIKGLMDSIAGRIVGMVYRVGLTSPVMLTGGVAKNKGVVKAIEERLSINVIVPKNPQIIGALGAALIAMDEANSRG